MTRWNKAGWVLAGILAGAGIWMGTSRPADGHCDTMDGPVAQAVQAALERHEVSVVLKWVDPAHEDEVKRLFDSVNEVRGKSPEVQRLVDRLFLETVVRFHRLGEGEPFEGVEPAGTDPGPAIRGVDDALATGKLEPLSDRLVKLLVEGLRVRFDQTRSLRRASEKDVESGRAYVEAYVQLMHYVEEVDGLVNRPLALHGPIPTPAIEPGHRH